MNLVLEVTRILDSDGEYEPEYGLSDSEDTSCAPGLAVAGSFELAPFLLDDKATRSTPYLDPEVTTGWRARPRHRMPRSLWDKARPVCGLGGLVLVCWAVWHIWGTGLMNTRAQAQLVTEFEQMLLVPEAEVQTQPTSAGEVPAPVDFSLLSADVDLGSAVALLRIPSIGVEQVVVEVPQDSDLRRGPGLPMKEPGIRSN